MQNSLFRRRLAIRACFDVLLDSKLVPLSSSPTTTDDTKTSLLIRRPFVFIHSIFFKF
jgi:hypothetical protein